MDMSKMTPARLATALAMGEQIGQVFADVAFERVLQDEQWGGPEHDDEHAAHEWVHYIDKQMEPIIRASQDGPALPEGGFRERMVKVAALAVAAVQAYDRNKAADDAVTQEQNFGRDPNADVCNCVFCTLRREIEGRQEVRLPQINGLERLVLALLVNGRRKR